MKFTIQFNLLRFGIIVALLFATSLKSVGQRSAPVHKPENKVALENHDSRAQSYVLKNLNRFGLDKLKDYDKALSESFSYELKDTLELMEKTYMNSSSSVPNLRSSDHVVIVIAGMTNSNSHGYHSVS